MRNLFQYTETLRPLYSSVDVTDVELLVDYDENARVNLTSLLFEVSKFTITIWSDIVVIF